MDLMPEEASRSPKSSGPVRGTSSYASSSVEKKEASSFVETQEVRMHSTPEDSSFAPPPLSPIRTRQAAFSPTTASSSASESSSSYRSSTSSSVTTTEKRLVHVYVEKAEVLQRPDEASHADPYVVVRCNGVAKQTRVQADTHHPVWKQEFIFDATEGSSGGGSSGSDSRSHALEFDVWDRDVQSAEGLVGTGRIGSTDAVTSTARTRRTLDLVHGEKKSGDILQVELWTETVPSCPVAAFPDPQSRFEGPLRSGLPHGWGVCVYADGSRYEGNYVDGLVDGWGTCVYPNGVVYDGEWKGDKKNGWGVQTWPSGHRYAGYWRNGEQEGKGTYVFPSGSVYRGDWVGSKQHGRGTYVWSNGQRYDGEWADDKKEGRGLLRYANGATYDGLWHADHQEGQGTRTYPDGSRYVGDNRNDAREGEGTHTDRTGKVVYRGLWRNGKPLQ